VGAASDLAGVWGGAPRKEARLLKASVAPDGIFTVTNTRNGFSKTYTAR